MGHFFIQTLLSENDLISRVHCTNSKSSILLFHQSLFFSALDYIGESKKAESLSLSAPPWGVSLNKPSTQWGSLGKIPVSQTTCVVDSLGDSS